MRQSSVLVVSTLVLGLSLAGCSACGQDAVVASRIKAASELMDVSQIDQKPWHMKVDMTAFDSQGANPRHGTIEIWNAGSDRKIVSTFGDAITVNLHHGEKGYWTGTNESDMPSETDAVLDEILHAGPDMKDIDESKPEQRRQKFGKIPLDCIMLTQPIRRDQQLPLGLFPTYCLDANNQIRSSYDFGNQAVILNRIGTFLGHAVPTQVDILEGEYKAASAKIIMLATYVPQVDEFAPGPNAHEIGTIPRIGGGVIAGNRLTFVQPVYPQGAKQRQESGKVILRAVIGRDGRIRSLRPESASDAEFALSAIAAVRHWTYKPYLLNGEPTAVDTTITVNYAIN